MDVYYEVKKMLYINKDKIQSLSELKYFGFKKESYNNFYTKECNDYNILVSRAKTDVFK